MMLPTISAGKRQVSSRAASRIGFLGALLCIAPMLLATAGVGTAAGMAGMDGHGSRHTNGVLSALLNVGPVLLGVAIGAFVVAVALRWWIAVFPALLGGLLLFWGMYGQNSVAVMNVSIVGGLLVWAVTWWGVGRSAPGQGWPVGNARRSR